MTKKQSEDKKRVEGIMRSRSEWLLENNGAKLNENVRTVGEEVVFLEGVLLGSSDADVGRTCAPKSQSSTHVGVSGWFLFGFPLRRPHEINYTESSREGQQWEWVRAGSGSINGALDTPFLFHSTVLSAHFLESYPESFYARCYT